ncbi:MAG: amino acid adenylation domain-containing protein, partial [Comamonadaceae bacterium]
MPCAKRWALAVKLATRVRSQLGLDVELAQLFSHPVLEQFAQAVSRSAPVAHEAIVHVDRSAPLALSFAQRRLWFVCQLPGASRAYHIPSGMYLDGQLDRNALGVALDALVARHESLRTTFVPQDDGTPVQIVAPQAAFQLREHDLVSVAHDQREQRLQQLSSEEVEREFDLAAGPLIRGLLVKLNPGRHLLLVTMHHIVSDGWSIALLTREFGELYAAAVQQRAAQLPPLEIQYADYAAWQRAKLGDEQLQAQARYWQDTLTGAPALLALPADHPRAARQDHRGDFVPFELDAPTTAALKALSQRSGATLQMTTLAAWAVVLGRLSGQHDVVIGTPTANRTRIEFEPLIGFFVNTLAIRLHLDGQPSALDMVQRTRNAMLAAQQNQDLPFDQVPDLVGAERSLAYTPLFQVMFSWENLDGDELRLPGLTVQPVGAAVAYRVAKFDLTLVLGEQGDRIGGGLEFATSLFGKATIERMLGFLHAVLQGMAREPAQDVHRLQMMPIPEQRTNVKAMPGSPRDVADTCIHELFEAQAARRPKAVAVACERDKLTYAQLNEKANRLARALRKQGAGANTTVAICVSRGIDMVVGLLAVLKSGAAYVPLDPAYPKERLAYMLRDARPLVLLTQGETLQALDTLPAGLSVLDLDQASQWAGEDATNLEAAEVGANSANLAYVIYTSGSTGMPKGVMVEHRQVVRLFKATDDSFRFGPADVWMLFHSYAFDFSVWEIWGALLHGARLVVVPYMTSRSPGDFYELVCRESVTVLNQTPSAFRQFIAAQAASDAEHRLRQVIFGGEALDLSILKAWSDDERNGSTELVNMYGITETTVHVTYWPLADTSGAPGGIGHPINDLQVYVLDPYLNPVPQGVVGEMHVGGLGVARGYLGKPDLTAQKFVVDPFSPVPGARMYRTGDLGRQLPDGTLAYMGRIDAQVKIRGFRIELGEIEAALLALPGVAQAMVIARDEAKDAGEGGTSGDRRLIAYVISFEGAGEFDGLVLRDALARTLPDFMLPAQFVRIEQFPLTPNGKVDLKALPEPGASLARAANVAPSTPQEQALADIWAQVLHLEQVGIHDNFFAAGGDSIRAVSVVARARDRGLAFSIADVFTYQTIGKLLQAMDLDEAELVAPGASSLRDVAAVREWLSPEDAARLPAGVERAYPMTLLQKGMVFHSSLSAGEDMLYHYVFSYTVGVSDLSEARLRAVLDAMSVRHPVLRTSFALSGFSEPLQLVHADARVPLVVADWRGHDEAAQQQLFAQFFATEKTRAFVLEEAPMLRMFVHRLGEESLRFTVSFHHAILDGWSVASLNTELLRVYENVSEGGEVALALQPLARTPEAAVLSERTALDSAEQQAFWRNYLDGHSFCALPPFEPDAPDSKTPPPSLVLDGAVRERLRLLASELGVPMRSLLLAAHLKVMSVLGGKIDVTTGLVSNIREEEADGEKVLGLFLNTLPVRQAMTHRTWRELIARTFASELDVIRHRHYPYFQLQLDNNGEPLYEAAFNYVNFHVYEELEKTLGQPASGIEAVESTNFAMLVSFSDAATRLSVALQLDPARVSPSQAGSVLNCIAAVLDAMATDPDGSPSDLDLLPKAQAQLLRQWNDTSVPRERTYSIHGLFEAQAARTPDAVALVVEDDQLT